MKKRSKAGPSPVAGERYVNPFTDFGYEEFFRLAGKFTPAERTAYQDSLKYYRDLKNSLDTSFVEGTLSKATHVIQKGGEAGLTIPFLAQLTDLTEAEVTEILAKLAQEPPKD
jgi:hypothetical protein